MNAKQTAMLEAGMLRGFLMTIPSCERRRLMRRVCDSTLKTRDYWYNWLYAKCRIPQYAKDAIEREAQRKIWDEVMIK